MMLDIRSASDTYGPSLLSKGARALDDAGQVNVLVSDEHVGGRRFVWSPAFTRDAPKRREGEAQHQKSKVEPGCWNSTISDKEGDRGISRDSLGAQGSGAPVFSGQFPVPTYVVEFMLGRYCASTDPAEIEEGVEMVQQQLTARTVRAGEEEPVQRQRRATTARSR